MKNTKFLKRDRTKCLNCNKKLKGHQTTFCSTPCNVQNQKKTFYPKSWSKQYIKQITSK